MKKGFFMLFTVAMLATPQTFAKLTTPFSLDDFVAPSVGDSASVTYGATGQIVYDISSDGFYGRDKSGTFKLLGGNAASQQTVYISETESSGTSGGTCTSGSFITRVLNTSTPASLPAWVTLSGNQITLAAGTYEVDGSAPAYGTLQHIAKLVNVTDSSDAVLGSSEYASSVGAVATRSVFSGQFTIASQKTFEVQHRCNSTSSTNGFGVASGFGTETYTVVRIHQVN